MNIAIADPQSRVRFSLRVLLEQQPGWKVAGEAADCQELLALVSGNCPDVLLVDWDLPGISPNNLIPLLRDKAPGIHIILMSWKQELRPIAQACGADAFVSKTDPPEILLSLVR